MEEMKRKTILLLGLMATVLAVAGGVALAATPKQCEVGVTCLGTGGDDLITGTSSADTIKARAGHDEVNSLAGADYVLGQDGIDYLKGGRGKDTLNGGSSPEAYDNSCGGTGADTLAEGAGYDMYGFEPNWGRDVISGQMNDGFTDLLKFDGACGASSVSAGLTVRFASGRAFETSAGSFNLSPNAVQWTPGVMEGVYTGSGNDTITGDGAFNSVHGEAGADTINLSGDLTSDFVSCGNTGASGPNTDGAADVVTVDSADTVANDCTTPEDSVTVV
jgi:Ca2+-binding RTX toxin-like protein